MTIPFNIGVLQLSMEPVHETVAMAKACEDAGFDTFWIAEAYPWWRKHSFEARSSTAILGGHREPNSPHPTRLGNYFSLHPSSRRKSRWKRASCRISPATVSFSASARPRFS